SKIDICYLLGFISLGTHRDLHLIRKIRNDFAHSASPIDFTNDAIGQRCGEFKNTTYEKDDQVTNRERFTRVVMGVLALVHAAAYGVKRVGEAKDVPIASVKENISKLVEIF